MRRALTFVLVVLGVLAAERSSAQLTMTNFGEGGSGGAPLVACGSGVIDLSAGCTITVMLRLGP